MDLNVIRGTQAHALLSDSAFIAEWDALQRECPWATSFQSPVFAREWYSTYRQPFEALLIVSRDASGRMNGLLPLANGRADGKLVVAGSTQAEYQAWICLPELGTSFPREAFDRLCDEFPSSSLRLRYLPARIPLGFLSDLQFGKTIRLKDARRPLMALGDGTEIEESFRKSGIKNRLRQLDRIGQVEFERITEPTKFANLLEEVARFHDFRQLALHGLTPFTNDSRKKAFYLAMMNTPGLLHISVLKVGDQIASVHLNIINGKEVQLFLVAHNPTFARYSPGRLHVLYLARMLQQEGYKQLDLKPGGDAHKERLATAADEVHTLTIFPRTSHRAGSVVGGRLRSVARKCGNLRTIGSARRLAGSGWDWMRSVSETRIYAYPAAKARSLQVADGMRRDSLADLLAYKPSRSGPSRQEFMAEAMDRFERGQHVYTCVEGGHLFVFGWLAEEAAEDTLREVALPPHSATVLKFQTYPQMAQSDLGSLALRTMLRDAGRVEGLQTIFIAIPGTDLSALDLVRAVGFNYQASIFKRIQFGRERSWSQLAPRAAERRTESKIGNSTGSDEELPPLQLVRPDSDSTHAKAVSQ